MIVSYCVTINGIYCGVNHEGTHIGLITNLRDPDSLGIWLGLY